MDYQHFNVEANTNDTVQVDMSSQANVYLMDDDNYKNYKTARPYEKLGGLATVSPYKITVPHTGYWHLVIDIEGLGGTIDALNVSVTVVPS